MVGRVKIPPSEVTGMLGTAHTPTPNPKAPASLSAECLFRALNREQRLRGFDLEKRKVAGTAPEELKACSSRCCVK
jgi:hypothetical protein